MSSENFKSRVSFGNSGGSGRLPPIINSRQPKLTQPDLDKTQAGFIDQEYKPELDLSKEPDLKFSRTRAKSHYVRPDKNSRK